MVAILVINYHQPLDVAWKFTVREFIMVSDFKNESHRQARQEWDQEKLGDFQQHLRNLGVDV